MRSPLAIVWPARHTARAAALLAVVAAVSLIGPDAGATAEMPETLEVRFGEGVTAETRWYVDAALAEAWRYFVPHLAEPTRFASTVVVVTSPDDAATAWADERGISVERARRLFSARSGSYAGLATTGLTVIINDNIGGPGATLHEFVHLFQHELAGRSQGPRWISEGAAQYFDMLIDNTWGIDAEARPPREANRTVADEWAATVGNCRGGLLPAGADTCRWAQAPLASLEAAAPFDIGGGAVSAYQRAAVAFQHLVDETSIDAYLCFLESQGSGSSWRTAFGACFEMPVEDFYELFDHSRDRGFRREVAGRMPAAL